MLQPQLLFLLMIFKVKIYFYSVHQSKNLAPLSDVVLGVCRGEKNINLPSAHVAKYFPFGEKLMSITEPV